MSEARHSARGAIRLILIAAAISLSAAALGADGFSTHGPAGPRKGGDGPIIRSVEPQLVGVGTRIRILGDKLGSADNAVVVFGGEVITNWIDKHADDEVIVSVPIGALAGPIRVVAGAGSAESLLALSDADRQAALARGHSGGSAKALQIIAPFSAPATAPKFLPPVEGGLDVIANHIIIEMNDFLGFEDAAQIGWRFGGRLYGFSAPSNSYFFELAEAPNDRAALDDLLDEIALDKRVRAVSPDIAMEMKQVRFAEPDFIDSRYFETIPNDPNGNTYWQFGREGAWHMDRIQAPAAWNLIKRFRPPNDPVSIAVLDTGCVQTHAEFAGVALYQINPSTNTIRFTIAGDATELPTALLQQTYNRGDPDNGAHGTAVCSIIGAENHRILPGATTDRGINGVVSGADLSYSLQIHRGGSGNFPIEPGEPGDTYTLTDFLPAINAAGITGCRVLNASWGQPRPINPNTHPDRNIVRVSLRKLARELNRYRDQLLLCVAAGNEGNDILSYNGGEVTPFEDFNLNNRLDAGEDVNGNGALDHGNYVGASLGTLPNVLTVGAIIGGQSAAAPLLFFRDDARWVDSQFVTNSASNWGSRRPGGSAQDAVVQIAAPGGREIFAAGKPYNATNNATAFQVGNQWYKYFGGTSAATPMTTGSAATLFALDRFMTAPEVKARLINTSYPIRTTDTNGADLDWNTLKLGAAVRQLLVDRGRITNDQAWSGTSRLLIVPNGNPSPWDVTVAEVRQNPVSRRSEIFRNTVVKTYAPDRPTSYSSAISPNGKQLNTDMRTQLWRYDIELDNDFQIISPPMGGRIWDRLPLAVLPNGDVILPWTVRHPDCAGFPFEEAELRIWRNNVAYATGAIAPADHIYQWRPQAAAKPDNMSVYTSITFNDITLNPDVPCEIQSSVNGDGGNVLAYPGPGGGHAVAAPPGGSWRDGPAWSPDGRLFLGRPFGGDWQVRRLTPTGTLVWSNTATVAGPWSPDGSELVFGFTTRRRNGNDPVALGGGLDRYFSWTW